MRVIIRTVDGQYKSDELEVESEFTEDDLEEFGRGLAQFRTMSYLSILIGGRSRFFNTANIIFVEIAR